jgi:hypothetical protein
MTLIDLFSIGLGEPCVNRKLLPLACAYRYQCALMDYPIFITSLPNAEVKTTIKAL